MQKKKLFMLDNSVCSKINKDIKKFNTIATVKILMENNEKIISLTIFDTKTKKPKVRFIVGKRNYHTYRYGYYPFK